MADIQASSSAGKTKTPAKKAATKANGKKAAATGGRTTVARPRKSSSPKARAEEPPPAHGVSPEERWRMVAEAAYLRAEQRGFSGGNPTDDWLAAEAEVDKYLSEK